MLDPALKLMLVPEKLIVEFWNCNEPDTFTLGCTDIGAAGEKLNKDDVAPTNSIVPPPIIEALDEYDNPLSKDNMAPAFTVAEAEPTTLTTPELTDIVPACTTNDPLALRSNTSTVIEVDVVVVNIPRTSSVPEPPIGDELL